MKLTLMFKTVISIRLYNLPGGTYNVKYAEMELRPNSANLKIYNSLWMIKIVY